MLSVGARAMTKHIQRKSGSFWGTVEGLNEQQRNENANFKIKSMLNEAVWINIHTLSKTTSYQVIVEVRTSLGYGARWDCNYDFKGLMEPQQEGLNNKKEKEKN